jgi:hypothetical protein
VRPDAILHTDRGTVHLDRVRHVLQREPGPHRCRANLCVLGKPARRQLHCLAEETQPKVRNLAGLMSSLLRSAGAPGPGLDIVTEPILGPAGGAGTVLLSYFLDVGIEQLLLNRRLREVQQS